MIYDNRMHLLFTNSDDKSMLSTKIYSYPALTFMKIYVLIKYQSTRVIFKRGVGSLVRIARRKISNPLPAIAKRQKRITRKA